MHRDEEPREYDVRHDELETADERRSREYVKSAGHHFRAGMKGYREEKGWSQRRLSSEVEKLGVKLDPSAITRIERGDRDPKHFEAVAISEALAMPLTPSTSSASDVIIGILVWLGRVDRLRDEGAQLLERVNETGADVSHLDNLVGRIPTFGYEFKQPHDSKPSLEIRIDDDAAT